VVDERGVDRGTLTARRWHAKGLCYVGHVTETDTPTTSYNVTCPHCGREFVADLLEGEAERHRGFKCPHCRLFVPYARAEETDRVEPAPSA
jgi:DNA-directed RNA polymerase subunit RPC12/RpoP